MLGEIDAVQRPIMLRVQLLESMQQHDSLFAHELLGMSQQLQCRRQDRIYQIVADQLAGGSKGAGHCSTNPIEVSRQVSRSLL